MSRHDPRPLGQLPVLERRDDDTTPGGVGLVDILERPLRVAPAAVELVAPCESLAVAEESDDGAVDASVLGAATVVTSCTVTVEAALREPLSTETVTIAAIVTASVDKGSRSRRDRDGPRRHDRAGPEHARVHQPSSSADATPASARRARRRVAPERTLEEIYKADAPGVVSVITTLGQGRAAQGSGIVLDTAGYILTNEHVIQGQKGVRVSFSNSDNVRAGSSARTPRPTSPSSRSTSRRAPCTRSRSVTPRASRSATPSSPSATRSGSTAR